MINAAVAEIIYQLAPHIFEREVPSGATLPALCYVGVGANPEDTLDNTGYRVARYQISAVAKSSADADALAKQLRLHLKQLKGTFAGVKIALIKEQNTIPDFSGDPDVYRTIIDFNFYYGE